LRKSKWFKEVRTFEFIDEITYHNLVVIHVIIELTSYFGVTDAKNMC